MTIDTNDPVNIAQGDPALLETELAQALLVSTIPARMAYVSIDGTPRIAPTWFHWTGEEVVMVTFICAPHVTRPARRLRDLRENPDVALSIDTEGFPPVSLTLRGKVKISVVAGVSPEYAVSAHRYLGEEAGPYLTMLDAPITEMARIALRPSWVGLLDFRTRQPEALGGIAS